MREARELAHERGRDQLRTPETILENGPFRIDEDVDGLEPRVEGRRHEILALAGEQAELVALTA